MSQQETEQEVVKDLPENYEELKRSANRMSNWKERLSAVEVLGEWNHPKIIDIMKYRVETDPVYSIKEAAFKKLQAFGVEVPMPEKEQTELFKGLTKILIRIKKSLPKDHSYDHFKEKLKKMRQDIYDTYEGDKGPEFDAWLEAKWKSLNHSINRKG